MLSRPRNHYGFTLIELIVVLLIISVMLAVTAPRLAGRSQAALLRAAAGDLQTLATAARARAVLQGQSVGLLLSNEGRELRLVSEQPAADPDTASGLTDVTPLRRLPEGIRASFRPEGDSAAELIRFQPDGSADGGELTLDDGRGGTLILQLSQPLGRLRPAAS
jgi:type II secretion system protein H